MILQEIEEDICEEKLGQLNNLHPKLKFTIEREVDRELAVLDIKLFHDHDTGVPSST